MPLSRKCTSGQQPAPAVQRKHQNCLIDFRFSKIQIPKYRKFSVLQLLQDAFLAAQGFCAASVSGALAAVSSPPCRQRSAARPLCLT